MTITTGMWQPWMDLAVRAPTSPHPTELKAVNDRRTALELSATMPDSVVYDWATGKQITE